MSLNISFTDKDGLVFSLDSGLPLISESTAQSYESNDSVYYKYNTITFDGMYYQQSDCSDFPPFYDLAREGTTGVLTIGGSPYTGHWTSFTSDSESTRWNRSIPYTATFTTFPSSGYKTYNSSFSKTVETLPYDQQYGPIYKVTVDMGTAGILQAVNDDTGQCTNVSLSGIRRAYKDLNLRYSQQVTSNSYFGFPTGQYEFYDLQGSTSFDDLTGEFSIGLSWIMKPFNSYKNPYHINSNRTESMDANMQRKIEKQGIIYGLSTGIFPTGIPLTDIDSCTFRSSTISFDTHMKYKHALSGLKEINRSLSATAGQGLLPEDSDWGGGVYFPKAKAPPMSTGNAAQSQLGYNPYAGTINYSYTFDDQAASIVSEAIVDSLTIRNKKPQYKTEFISIIGRRHGPIVKRSSFDYDVGITSVTYEGVFPKETSLKKYSFRQSIIDKINTIVKNYAPTADNISIAEDKQDLNLTSNKVTRTITWHYSACSS